MSERGEGSSGRGAEREIAEAVDPAALADDGTLADDGAALAGGCGRLVVALAAEPAVLYGAPGVPPEDSVGEKRAALDAHAAECATCAEALGEHAQMDALLRSTFRWLDGELRPQRQAVLARIGDRPSGDPELDGDEDPAIALRLRAARLASGRQRARRRSAWLLVVNGLAAVLLLTGYATYASIARVHKEQLARGTRMDVHNLAAALRARAAERAGDLPEGGAEALVAALRPSAGRAAGRADGGAAGGDAATGEPAGRSALAAEPVPLALADRVRDGRLIDGYGRPFVYSRDDARQARVYSLGRNGRDDGGAGDDVVAWVRLD